MIYAGKRQAINAFLGTKRALEMFLGDALVYQKSFAVTSALTHITASVAIPATAPFGSSIITQLSPDNGYAITSVTVTMNGVSVPGAYDAETGFLVIDNITGDVEITSSVQWIMPFDAYVEYIRATGSQYVTFSVSAASGDSFGVILDFVNKTTATSKNLLKDQRSSSNQFKMATYSHNDETGKVTFSTTVGTKSQADGIGGGIQVPDNERCEIELSTVKKRVNDNDTAISRPLTNSISSLTLLSSGYSADIHAMTVYKNGQNLLELIPVRKNGVGYLYDKISGELAGTYTGSFSYGPDT